METTLDLVFLWHMHQPDYRDHGQCDGSDDRSASGSANSSNKASAKVSRCGTAPDSASTGEFVLPWVYLHALKDYVDMAAHLERHPHIRCVVNFVPVLLEQIEDYANQFAEHNFRDPLLRLLATDNLDAISADDRQLVLHACFRSNHHTMLQPFPHYQRLLDTYTLLTKEGSAPTAYLSGAYFSDLLTWYHLAWTGETVRRQHPRIAELMSKGQGYDANDRGQLLAIIGEQLSTVIPRYRALAERGQIELSSTPQTHPLAPLLIDFKTARETVPDAPLPFAPAYPGGHTRVCAHIDQALASHQTRFGQPPAGMWPAEGAVSEALVRHLEHAGVRWIASGEGVLRNTLHANGITDQRAAYHPWQLAGAPNLTLFFRDERLSDLIGFDYAKWHGRDAAQHLVGELEAILNATPAGERAVVGIIMDGENAWEHYPYNGYYFFDDLYGLLAEHPRIRTTTYADVLKDLPPPRQMPHLVAGSWVYGTLSTWIGDTQKNRAWDLLCTAKQSYDMVLASGRLSPEETAMASRQLAICESSDWFWWFGDYNPAAAVASFDGLFRRNLAQLYRCLKIEPPAQLTQAISFGTDSHDTDGGGTMRRGSINSALPQT